MSKAETLITAHVDIWTSAVKAKASAGRGSGKKQEFYGIKKLRELILELAVRGLLVPQDSKDEPTSELLKKVAKEKATLIKEGKFKKQEQPPLKPAEWRYNLPIMWQWVRFGDIALHNAGKTLDSGRNSGDLRDYITTSNLYWGYFDLTDVRQMPIREEELEKCSATKGDLLICEGGEAGRASVWTESRDICFQNHIHRARLFGGIDPFYAYRFFEHLSMSGQIEKYRKGVGISNMSGKALASIVFPLPPLAEQHRIVAKVDELMALCDRLERLQEDSVRTHASLVETLLGALTAASERGAFAEAWQRIASHFDTLFTTESSIDQLKQTILQLAVMGKLVEQDPEDEPASDLLNKVAKQRAQLVKEGKLKKQKPLPLISSDETPFTLPDQWVWCKFGLIGEFINGDRSKNYPHTSEYVSTGIPWINTGHIEPDGTLTKSSMNYISKEKFDSLRGGKVELGDLVYCLRGATFGKTAFITPYSEGAIASSLMIIRPHIKELGNYIYRYLISPFGRSQIFRFDNGSAQPNLSANSVTIYAFPLPPLAEQHRIVAKVDELMSLCGRLKARLQSAQATQLHLADTLAKTATHD